ncbi:MAG: MetQ/NlpA family ABC transporter substrate-binding protein [Gammaproteobacteria bacterium]|nr:MetQ/NlpA family ABC transporter substrate-binding protein [Gammaproteobacteria bacterium]MCH9744515.1 MetQ/NlpA family ABC transporter substrate-binding protein [Gammaproteobacteria bacterium]
MKNFIKIIITLFCFVGLSACSHSEPLGTITVGTIAGPETQLMETAAKVAWQRYKLKVKIVTFSDYNTPNVALSDGSIDANAFQHIPYLKNQIKQHGYKIVPAGRTFLFPIGAYSLKIKHITQLKSGSTIAIPNDPTNEARALRLLQKYDIVRLKKGAGFDATTADIIRNPLHVKFVELDAADIARALRDVDLAVINSTYVTQAGLSLKDAIVREGLDSPYVNVIAIRTQDSNKIKIRELVKAYQSKAVLKEAKQLFGEAAVQGWTTTQY